MIKNFLLILLLTLGLQANQTKSLYERLGGYDNIAAMSKDFHLRLKSDPQLGRFWANRGEDGLKRELQLLIDFICANAGGPTYYMGRDMPTTHIGMKISNSDWNIFMSDLNKTLDKFKIKKQERNEVINFISSFKSSIVEVK